MKTISLAMLLILTCSSVANACSRCGRRQCRFSYSSPVQKPIQRPVQKPYYPAPQQPVQQAPQQVINLANVYPQGQTQYTAASVAQLTSLNPDLAVQAASRVADNAVTTLSSSITQGLESSVQVAEVAKMQAAVSHLRTALQGSSESSVTLRVTQGGSGMQIERVPSGGRNGYGENVPAEPTRGSLLQQKCGKCHGTQLSSPKAGLYLSSNTPINHELFGRAVQMVAQDKMPPENPLSDKEKDLIMDELLSLINSPDGENQ